MPSGEPLPPTTQPNAPLPKEGMGKAAKPIMPLRRAARACKEGATWRNRRQCIATIVQTDIMFNLFKKKKLDWVHLPAPDDSILFFEAIKQKSEYYWAETTPNPSIYGCQQQGNSQWKPGLTDNELKDFEMAIGYEFPLPLKNFYKTMNGLTKPGINVFGSDGTKPTFKSLYYSYPDDLPVIEELINWIYEENKVNASMVKQGIVPAIFPVYQHRFMLTNSVDNPILSMHGADIIYWSDSLSKLLANEIFDANFNIHDFESNPINQPEIKFWLDEKQYDEN
ncbi:SMI1/KNR4 family protein [Mucilaginibacter psychrotolerans]|uniref:Knr4/Smi1-like domain-containing protein n=1 Tax=Mucilaginibacter psychrotolerans TaxID=1524096 RepID=A0A4Y8SDB5_9SPHI|nr:SMI1/KNR4 family protein [Mucilaginibacter psychrotolerans]TFF36918.1 hypothetical protein E2R66_14250 [Mucilaginibacter psychrotolerans]